MPTQWDRPTSPGTRRFVCGFCGSNVASNLGYNGGPGQVIFLCPQCDNPNYFLGPGDDPDLTDQIPGATPGRQIGHLPEVIGAVLGEARRCIANNAYTASVLLMRTLLMHIAVEKGAAAGQRFNEYVNYLSDQNYLPPDGREWVDRIRTGGNEAAHDIVLKEKVEAERLHYFLEMLLIFIYEIPGELAEHEEA